MQSAIITAVFLLVFLNGATDACTSISTAVASRALSMKRAAILCALCNGVGGILGTLLFGGIGDAVVSASDFGTAGEAGVLATLLASALFAAAAWAIALPTSESHGILAAAAGASAALGGSDSMIQALLPALLWMSLCILAGALAGTVLPRLIPSSMRAVSIRRWQILSAALSSFLHGVQDLSKFCALLSLMDGGIAGHPVTVLAAALLMGLGALCGGRRMTDAVGEDLALLPPKAALGADLACDSALLFLSLVGIPASTTHTKTAAVAACAATDKTCRIRKKQFFRCVGAWILTFPACGWLGYFFARLITAVM